MIPSPMRRLVPLIAVLAASALAMTASADARPLSDPLQAADARVDWSNLRPAERQRVLRRWAEAPSVLDPLLERVAARLTIRRSGDGAPGGGNNTETQHDGSHETWQVNLSPAVLNWGSKLGAHLTLHELGHVIDGALIDDTRFNEFLALFARHPAWSPCYPQPQGSSSRCVPATEIFAEQFGFWATGYRRVRTSYGVSPLASRRDIGHLLERLLRPRR